MAESVFGIGSVEGQIANIEDAISVKTSSQRGVSTTAYNSNSYAVARFVGNICILSFAVVSSSAVSSGTTIVKLNGFHTKHTVWAACTDVNHDKAFGCDLIQGTDIITLNGTSAAGCSINGQVVFTYELD